MRPGRRYEATQDAGYPLGVNFVHFDLLPETDERTKQVAAWTPPFEAMETLQVELVDAVMRRIIELESSADPERSADHWLTVLLQELCREQSLSQVTQIGGLQRHHRDLIHRIAHRIREQPAGANTVQSLASQAGYSVDHFSRVFTEVMGRRPQRFVIDARLERARQLLLESPFTIGEVASAVGFSSVHFFSRQFTQYNGCTPSDYRRRPHLKRF